MADRSKLVDHVDGPDVVFVDDSPVRTLSEHPKEMVLELHVVSENDASASVIEWLRSPQKRNHLVTFVSFELTNSSF